MNGHSRSTEDPSGRRQWRDQAPRGRLPPDGEQPSGRSAEISRKRGRDIGTSVLSNIGALVVVLDREGRIVRFNRACEQLTGYTSQEVKGRRIWDLLLVSEEVAPVMAVFKELRSGHFPNEYKNHWVTKDGRRRLMMWSNTILPDEQGDIEYVIGTGIDIIEEEQTQQSLRKARDAFEQRVEEAEAELAAQRLLSLRADRLRSLGEMAAGIAHELNQPLVGVRGLAEHLLIGMDRGWNLSEEKLRDKLSLIVEQADRMSHIIERVRMFARDAGKPETRPVKVNDVVHGALSMLGPQLRTRGIALAYELAEALPMVRVNPMSLEEVVVNLVMNAADALVETTEEGVPSTSLRILMRTRKSREGDQERVQIQVIDEAAGIPEELLAKVFEPFLTTKGPDLGTGLGLAICKYIVEQVGGVIGIESAVGRGTTVTVSLPAATENRGGES